MIPAVCALTRAVRVGQASALPRSSPATTSPRACWKAPAATGRTTTSAGIPPALRQLRRGGRRAKILGLDRERFADALGIAGTFTGGIWAFLADGAMTKRFHPGKASENGLSAALLAQAGMSGPRQVLEAKWGGFFSTYVARHRHARGDAWTASARNSASRAPA